MAHVLLILVIVSLGPLAHANSCCGQGPASYTVLSMNQKLSFSTGVSYLSSQGRVLGDSGKFYVWEDKKREVRSVPFNIAGSIADRQQAFVNMSILQGRYSDEEEQGSSTHLSDTLLGYTYEVLPEYSFSYWKPVVFLTGFLNVPTGRSVYERRQLSEGADVTGHDQWGTGVGLTLRKVYFPWTLTLQARTIRLFAKTFESENSQSLSRVQVSDFHDSSLAFLTNYSSRWWNLQWNGGLTFTHLSERKIEPSQVTSGVTQNFSLLMGLQKPISETWSAGASYSDQTLVGPAKNTILNRTVSIQLNYNQL